MADDRPLGVPRSWERRTPCPGPRRPPPLPEAAPDLAVWADVLWPWLDAVDRRCPGWVLATARDLAHACDARDLTVDVERAALVSAWTRARAVGHLVALGLLAACPNGRHRFVSAQ
jgi:hypothetical protein